MKNKHRETPVVCHASNSSDFDVWKQFRLENFLSNKRDSSLVKMLRKKEISI